MSIRAVSSRRPFSLFERLPHPEACRRPPFRRTWTPWRTWTTTARTRAAAGHSTASQLSFLRAAQRPSSARHTGHREPVGGSNDMTRCPWNSLGLVARLPTFGALCISILLIMQVWGGPDGEEEATLTTRFVDGVSHSTDPQPRSRRTECVPCRHPDTVGRHDAQLQSGRADHPRGPALLVDCLHCRTTSGRHGAQVEHRGNAVGSGRRLPRQETGSRRDGRRRCRTNTDRDCRFGPRALGQEESSPKPGADRVAHQW